jgi:uncharacterized protein
VATRPLIADGRSPIADPGNIILTNEMVDSEPIRWREWSTEAFCSAQTTGRVVLLSLVTRWSTACRAMDATVFAETAVADAVGATAIPVRVDADRRPDIADRYGLGAWPTTAFLTPEGDLLGGGTFVDAARLESALRALHRALQSRRAELAGRAAADRQARAQATSTPQWRQGVDDALDVGIADWVADRVFSTLAEVRDARLVLPGQRLADALVFALRWADERADGSRAACIDDMLDRLAARPFSEGDGGFPHTFTLGDGPGDRDDDEGCDRARVLEVQAAFIDLFLEGSVRLRTQRYADRACAALAYVDRVLADSDGGFFHSESQAGVDRTLFTDANARMVRTLFVASRVLGDITLAERAVTAIERLVPAVYKPGAGLAHYLDGRAFVRGLLADQVETSLALLDAAEVAGERAYLELAEELMRSCLRKLWDQAGGGFVDRLRTPAGGGDIGLLGEPRKPLAANCAAATILARLAEATGAADLAERSRETLASQRASYQEEDLLAVEYALACEEVRSRLGR